MSDPIQSPDSEPTGPPRVARTEAVPFDPPVAGGFGKPLLVMGGAVVVLGLAALVVFALKAGPLLALTFRTAAPTIVERLSEEVGEAERMRLEAAFEAAAKKAESGDLDQELLLAVQRRFTALAGAVEIGASEASELTHDLEALAGVEPPPVRPMPVEGGQEAEAGPGLEAATEVSPESADPPPDPLLDSRSGSSADSPPDSADEAAAEEPPAAL